MSLSCDSNWTHGLTRGKSVGLLQKLLEMTLAKKCTAVSKQEPKRLYMQKTQSEQCDMLLLIKSFIFHTI